MASFFDKPTPLAPATPIAPAVAAPAKATTAFAYGDDLQDDVVNKTAPMTIRADACVVQKRKLTLLTLIETKTLSSEETKEPAKVIDACRDHTPITFRLVDGDGDAVSELKLTFADLKVLKGPHVNNELAIRSAARFAGSLAVAYFEGVQEDGDAIKATFVTGDKKYGARTVVSLPKPAPLQATRVEIVNLPNVPFTANMG